MTRKKSNKIRLIDPVHPSAAIKSEYERKIRKKIIEMINSTEYWVRAWYRNNPPKLLLALDESPSKTILSNLSSLENKWLQKFSYFAKDVAPIFTRGVLNYSDTSFLRSLKKAGLNVSFEITRQQQDVTAAIIVENVKLIKSIPSQYFKEINFIVTDGFMSGRDLSYITTELKSRYSVTAGRATLIARDQCNKATSSFNRLRQVELGINEAIWIHSKAARKPRKSHVAASGKRYKVEEGCLIDDKYILPGQLINCGCISKSVFNI